MQKNNNLPYIIFITLIAALGGFLFGYDFGVINGAVKALELEFSLSSTETGLNVGILALGCIVGALMSGWCADKFGRKATMMLMCIFFIVSAAGCGWARTSTELMFYRVVGGVGVGAASAICPAYICEIAPVSIRGMLASAQQLAIVSGLFAAFLVNYLISLYSGSPSEKLFGFTAWRFMFWAEAIPAFIFLLGIFFIPESPRFLIAKKKFAAAKKVISKISNFHIDEEIEKIKLSLKGKKPSIKDIFKENSFKLHGIVLVGMFLAASQQLTGVNIILNYGEVLWTSIGFDTNNALLQNVIISMVNIVSTVVAILLIDKIGRKILLLVGSLTMAILIGAMGFIFSQGTLVDGHLNLPDGYGIAAFFVGMAFVATFAGTWGPVLWVLLGEMFPNSMRASAIGLCSAVLWLSNFFVLFSFPIMNEKLGLSMTYIIYTVFPLLAFFFVKFFVRETKNVTLEDMQSE